ncbi:MAG: DNA ligase [Burkholderiaceae bacterium]
MPMPIPRRRLNEWLALGLLAPPAWAAVAQSPPPPPPLLLAHKAPPGLDPAPYLVSEKLDGVRAYWDGRAMHSRQGHPMALPAWFAERLPARALDGELWIGRGRFEAASAAVRRVQPRDEEWRQLHYMLFELPAAPGSFEQRCAELRRIEADARWDGLRAVPQERVADAAALSRRLSAVVAGGGEGLMLHAADAPYRSGRDAVLLKLKPQDDDEAVVLGHVAGAGRLAGTLGALRVRSVDGREFLLGSGFTDAQRRAPPPVGAVVTYRYRGLTSKGLPRFASFVRVQEDV